MQLKIGQKAPNFTLPSHLDKEVSLSDFHGRTVLLAFFPRAWTPVCSSQIPAYEAILDRFASYNVQVLGISIDHTPCLKAWAESMGGISYPILSDFWPHGEIAKRYDVLRPEGYSERAIFLIDPDGVIRYIDVHDIDEQPDIDVLFAEIQKINPAGAVKAQKEDVTLPHGGVVIYCTPWCPECKQARAWLKENKISYKEVDISMIRKGGMQVRQWTGGKEITPTFEIDGTVIVEFQVEKVREALKM